MLFKYLKALFYRPANTTDQIKLGSRILASTVEAEQSHVDAYNHICDWSSAQDFLHPLYFQVLSLPLQLDMMVTRPFPFKATGLVHLANAVKVHRMVARNERITLNTRFAKLYRHKKGFVFELITDTYVNDELCLESTSYYLSQQGSMNGQASGFMSRAPEFLKDTLLAKFAAIEKVRFAPLDDLSFFADTGRTYAKISGDYNPIHLWPVTAKLFGFDSAIAHGMLSQAKMISRYYRHIAHEQLPIKPVHIKAAFHSAIPLPKTCQLTMFDSEVLSCLALTSTAGELPKHHVDIEIGVMPSR